MRISRDARWGAGVGVLTVLVAAALLGFSPIVRSRVTGESHKRALQISVDTVRPGWLAVHLGGVKVRLDGVEDLEANFGSVSVDLTPWFTPRAILFADGNINAKGDFDRLRAELAAWRATRLVSEKRDEHGELVLRAVRSTIHWDDGVTRFLAEGLDITRDREGTHVRIAGGSLRHDTLSLETGPTACDLDTLSKVSRVQTATAEVTWSAGARPGSDPPAASPAVDLAPPPLPTVLLKGRLKAPKAIPSARDDLPIAEASAPLVPLPDLRLMRASAESLVASLAKPLSEGAIISVEGLGLHLRRGTEDRLALGPGPLKVQRGASSTDITFSTAAGAAGTPLALHATLPHEGGDVVVSLEGGPVALSLLGLRTKTLTDVDRTMLAGKGRMVLDRQGKALIFDLELTLRGLAAEDPRLAAETLRGLDFDVRARGVLSDAGELRLDDAEAAMGALHVQAHGRLQQAEDHVALAADFELPVNSCEAILGSIPSALLPTLRGAQMTGTLGAQGRLVFDTRRLDDLVLDYVIDDQCRMTGVPPDLERDRFTKPFVHRIYSPDGKLGEEMTGPDTDNWTSLDRISPFMQAAVLTTEDGAFFHHRGFNHLAIRNALLADLKARRFVRGASTVTMQLAKNLFLSRDKTLSRKLEELILTDYLEQAFTKDEMLELYLNVIEFGPNVYGITAASEHYFGRKPDELNLAECMFLSSILPKPVRYHYLYERGELSDSWLRGIRARMLIAQRTGKITEVELADGLTEAVVFHMPNTPRPPPRPPVAVVRSDGDEADLHEFN